MLHGMASDSYVSGRGEAPARGVGSDNTGALVIRTAFLGYTLSEF